MLNVKYFDPHTKQFIKDAEGQDITTSLKHVALQAILPDAQFSIAVLDERVTAKELEENHPLGHRLVLGGSQLVFADAETAKALDRLFPNLEAENIFGVKDACAYGSLLTSECGGQNEQLRLCVVDENSPEAEIKAAEATWTYFQHTGILQADLDSGMFLGEDPAMTPQLLLPKRAIPDADPSEIYVQTPKQLAEKFNTHARRVELSPAILTSKLNILIVNDDTGENGGILDYHCAKQILQKRCSDDQITDLKKAGRLIDALTEDETVLMKVNSKALARSLTGDCAGVISLELAKRKFDTDTRQAVQFRGHFTDFDKGLEGRTQNLDHANLAVDKICKGSLVGFDLKSIELENGSTLDSLMAISMWKGAIKPTEGLEERQMWLSDKDISRQGTQSMSSLISLYPDVLVDILPTIETKLANLGAIQNDYTKLATLYCDTYEKRQQQYVKDLAADNAFDGQFLEDSSSEQSPYTELPAEKYKFFKAILDSQNYSLLQSSLSIVELKKFVRTEFLNLSQGIDPDIKFDRGFARPSKDLKDGEICVPWMPEGAQIVGTRPPIIDTNGVNVFVNKYVGFNKDTPKKDRPNFISCNDSPISGRKEREIAEFEKCLDKLRLTIKNVEAIDDRKSIAENQFLLTVNLKLLEDLKQQPDLQSIMKDFGLDFDGDCVGVALATDFPNLAKSVELAQLNGGFDPIRSIQDLPESMQAKLVLKELKRDLTGAKSYINSETNDEQVVLNSLKVRLSTLDEELATTERPVNRYPDTIKEKKLEFLGMSKEAAALQMQNTCVGVIANTMTKIQSQISSIDLLLNPKNGASNREKEEYSGAIVSKNTDYIKNFEKRAASANVVGKHFPDAIKAKTVREFLDNPDNVAKFREFLLNNKKIAANPEAYFRKASRSQTIGDFVESQKHFIVTPNNLSKDSKAWFDSVRDRIEVRTNLLAKMPIVEPFYQFNKEGALDRDTAGLPNNKLAVLISVKTFANSEWLENLAKKFPDETKKPYWLKLEKEVVNIQSQARLTISELSAIPSNADATFEAYEKLQENIVTFKLSTGKALLRELVPIGSYQNQIAVDMPKSARVADMNAISALNQFNITDLKVITEKKEKSIFSSKVFTLNGYNPSEMLAEAAIRYYSQNMLKAEKPESFKPLFADVDYSARQYSAMLSAKQEFERDWNLGSRLSIKAKNEEGAVLNIVDSKGRTLEITNINKFDHKLSYDPDKLKGLTFSIETNTTNPDYKSGEYMGIDTYHNHVVVVIDSTKPDDKPRVIGTLCETSKDKFVSKDTLYEPATFVDLELSAPQPDLSSQYFEKARNFAAIFAKSVPEDERMSYAAALWNESTNKKGTVSVDDTKYTDAANSMTSSINYFWMKELDQKIRSADLTTHKIAFLESQSEISLGTQIQFEVKKEKVDFEKNKDVVTPVVLVDGNQVAYVQQHSYPIDATGKAFTGEIINAPPTTLLMKIPGIAEPLPVSKCGDYDYANKSWADIDNCKIKLDVLETNTYSLMMPHPDPTKKEKNLGKLEKRAADLIDELGLLNQPDIFNAQGIKLKQAPQEIIITPRSYQGDTYLQLTIPAKGDRPSYTFSLNRNQDKDGKDAVNYADLGLVVDRPTKIKLNIKEYPDRVLGVLVEKDGVYERIGHVASTRNAFVKSDGSTSTPLVELVKAGIIEVQGLTKGANGLVTGDVKTRAGMTVIQPDLAGSAVINTNKAYAIKINKNIEPVSVPVIQAEFSDGFRGRFLKQHSPVIVGVSTLGAIENCKESFLKVTFDPNKFKPISENSQASTPKPIDPVERLISEKLAMSGIDAIQNKSDLIESIQSGNKPDLLLFYGHNASDKIDSACLSQHYPRSFSDESGVKYPTAEHYMMAKKAELFEDRPMLDRILQSETPKEAKYLGRQVGKSDGAKPFDAQTWDANCTRIVTEANVLKFSQNPDLKEFLLATDSKVLVEASPSDAKWGIKLSKDDPKALDPLQWQGENQLGFALMNARENIRSQELTLAVNDVIQSGVDPNADPENLPANSQSVPKATPDLILKEVPLASESPKSENPKPKPRSRELV